MENEKKDINIDDYILENVLIIDEDYDFEWLDIFDIEDEIDDNDGEEEITEEYIDPYENITDPERLDTPHYDSWAPSYDYTRPIRITAVEYHLQATQQEVEEIAKEMKRTNSSKMIIVPYYNKDGLLEHSFYEGLVVKEFCTRHLLDNDYQYSAEKWNYYDGIFRFAVFDDEMLHIASYFHHKLGTEISEGFVEEVEAKREWYENSAGKYQNYDDMQNAYREWTMKWIEDHRKN